MTAPATPTANTSTSTPPAARATVRRLVATAALVAVLAPGLAACNVPFLGGGTSCKDFLNASSADRRTIAAKAFPQPGPLQDPVSDIGFYCSTHVGSSVSDIAP
jgi:hypothetical protein